VATVDPSLIADEAGLVYGTPTDVGITRRRRGRGFTYLAPGGGTVDTTTRRWIEQLAIPPAWTDVWISAEPNMHILAIGVDDAGRTQYRYHPEFRRVADELKFARLGAASTRLPRVRRAVTEALAGDERTRMIALAAHLIDRSLIRVGTERYVGENDSFGACTLRRRHARVEGNVVYFDFRAKGGVRRRFRLDDAELARHIAGLNSRPSAPLLATSAGWVPSGEDVATFLTEAAGVEMTAKDLRTLGASACMVDALCARDLDESKDPLLAAYDVVAAVLGNTRVVARSSYVAPAVVVAWEEGSLAATWKRCRAAADSTRAERVLSHVLQSADTAEGPGRATGVAAFRSTATL
jgi:DNA topoisomerase-1